MKREERRGVFVREVEKSSSRRNRDGRILVGREVASSPVILLLEMNAQFNCACVIQISGFMII
jgi:hypothetical protein